MSALAFAALAWFLCGVAGFVFWWTEDYEFRPHMLPDALAVGILGPLALLAGYLIHRELRPDADEEPRRRDGGGAP